MTKDLNLSVPIIKASYRVLGHKQYELSNHLGNVLVVVSDRKLPYTTNGTTVDYYTADITSANDYYAFGAQMPGRSFNSPLYRFGFGSQEKDDEISGNGNAYDFDGYGYDPRTGRRKSRDPHENKYPGLSPYAYSFNNPIVFNDPNGKDGRLTITNNPNGGGTITFETTIHLYGT